MRAASDACAAMPQSLTAMAPYHIGRMLRSAALLRRAAVNTAACRCGAAVLLPTEIVGQLNAVLVQVEPHVLLIVVATFLTFDRCFECDSTHT
jgi:hypothetical protein